MELTPLGMNRLLYSKLRPYFTNCSITNQRQRSIFKDIKYTIKLVCSAHKNPPLFLYLIGLLVFSDNYFAINLSKATDLFQYSKVGIKNFMNKRKYIRVSYSTDELPINFTEIPLYKKWIIFKIPKDDVLSTLFHEFPAIHVKSITDFIDDKKNDKSNFVGLMIRGAQADIENQMDSQ